MIHIERLQNDSHTERMQWIDEQGQNRAATKQTGSWNQAIGGVKMNAETMVKFAKNGAQWVAGWLNTQERKIVHNKIIDSAYVIFTNSYPDAVDVCFDEHFVKQIAMPLLVEFVSEERDYSAKVLAESWADQFFYTAAKRENAVVEITEMAAEFIYILQSEAAVTIQENQLGESTTLSTRYASTVG